MTAFLNGLLVALVFGVPAGAIGALTIQRTLERGFWHGFVTGMGCSAADVIYACVGAFGITLISDFLQRHQLWIQLLGGALIAAFGMLIIRRKAGQSARDGGGRKLFSCFMTSFSIAILNPATVVAFMLTFAALDIREPLATGESVLLVLGILLGTLAWWAALSGIVSIIQRRFTEAVYLWMNRILGVFMIVFGLAMCVRSVVSSQ